MPTNGSGLIAGDLGVIGRDELRCVTGDETHARLSLRLGPGRSPMGVRLNATSGALGRLLASPRVVWVRVGGLVGWLVDWLVGFFFWGGGG